MDQLKLAFEVVNMEQMEAVSLEIPLISRFIERSGGKCKIDDFITSH